MSQILKPIKIGVQRLDNTANIVVLMFPCDPGNNFRPIVNVKIKIPFGTGKAKFSYCNNKNGNCIYRECEQ